MLFAQSFAEYGGGSGIAAQFAASIQAGAYWIELSVREHRPVWIIAGVAFGLWIFRRR